MAAILIRYFKYDYYFVAKPLPIFALLAFLSYHLYIFLSKSYFSYGAYYIFIWTLAGLIFGLAGDILLLKDHRFLIGIYSFLAAQIFYIIAFIKSDFTLPWQIIFPLIFLGLAYGFYLTKNMLGKKNKKYIIAVWIYLIAILTMMSQAINWNLTDENHAFPFFSIGAILFCISDSIIAWDRFIRKFYLAQLFILFFYYFAQALIVFGALLLIRS